MTRGGLAGGLARARTKRTKRRRTAVQKGVLGDLGDLRDADFSAFARDLAVMR